ncbi:MAG: hypothetical protein ABJZ55_16200 [Fuerstiella sp.]
MKSLLVLLFCIVASVAIVAYEAFRPWPQGAWDAADHDRNGLLTRNEMQTFGGQKSHRNTRRLMMHFDAADTNDDEIVDGTEIEAYGSAIGSKDPYDHLPPAQSAPAQSESPST